MEEYRKFSNIILAKLEKREIDISQVLQESQNIEVPEGVIRSWAVFPEDEKICQMADEVLDSQVKFRGTKQEIAEFIIRFLLSQLLLAWKAPLVAVLSNCLDQGKVRVSELNRLLSNWDYTNAF